MSEREDEALDEEALEASTVIERRQGATSPAKVRLSPLQPLARVDTLSAQTPAPAELRLVLPDPAAIPPEPPPLPLLRPGSEPARPLADPWPAGSARRSSAPRVQAVATRPAGGRRLVVVGLLGFAAGAVARHLWNPWPAPPAPVEGHSTPGAGLAGAAPAAVVAPPASVTPAAAPRAPTGQKRKRGRGF